MSTGPILLILGGTTEARLLAHAVADAGLKAIYSYAGRTKLPEPLPVPTRIGGFGGPDGLADYIGQAGVTHIIDATHPFAETMSKNAVLAAARLARPLLALTRPPWKAHARDTWIHAPDMESAVAALDTDPQRVFLAIGRKEIARFAQQPQHHYLLRLVDAPSSPPPLPHHDIVVAKGPFNVEADRALLLKYGIGLIVSKNAGGTGARAKLEAARGLDIPVLMVDRPRLPKREEVHSVDDAIAWVQSHSGTLRGV
ncbi:MAG: cobalt-precorrin-6A reductase [Pseudomonadota bacterium]